MEGLPTIMLSPSREWPIEAPDPEEQGGPCHGPRQPRALRRLAAVAAVVFVSFALGAFADAFAFATPCRSTVQLTRSLLLHAGRRAASPIGRSIAMAESTDAGAVPDRSTAGTSAPRPIKALGVTVSAVTPQIRRKIGLPDTVEGVIIAELAFDGVAAQARLLVNDVIERIGDRQLRDPADLEAAIRSMPETGQSTLRLTISRGGVESVVAVRVGEE